MQVCGPPRPRGRSLVIGKVIVSPKLSRFNNRILLYPPLSPSLSLSLSLSLSFSRRASTLREETEEALAARRAYRSAGVLPTKNEFSYRLAERGYYFAVIKIQFRLRDGRRSRSR
jgi:hypothetical protein